MKPLELLYMGLYRLFRLLLRHLSPKKRVALARKLANAAWLLSPSRRRVIETNLEIAFPKRYDQTEKARIGQNAYTNLIMAAFTVIRMPELDEKSILETVRFENDRHVRDALARGEKIIFIAAHYGNWELAPAAMALRYGFKGAVVGRKLDSDAMDKELTNARRRFGLDLIYKRGAVKGCVKALAEGKVLGLLTDQSLPKKYAVPVTFFGKEAGHTPLAAMLARRHDALVIPFGIHTSDHLRHTIRFYDPLPLRRTDNAEEDIRRMAQDQADAIERIIREDPNLWFWPHKRWKTYHPEYYGKNR
jgi:KDO2-lipid IV(A) lauroyltransferase